MYNIVHRKSTDCKGNYLTFYKYISKLTEDKSQPNMLYSMFGIEMNFEGEILKQFLLTKTGFLEQMEMVKKQNKRWLTYTYKVQRQG